MLECSWDKVPSKSVISKSWRNPQNKASRPELGVGGAGLFRYGTDVGERLAGAHLHRESPAIDAVLRAIWTIALAPVELHLLCFEAAR